MWLEVLALALAVKAPAEGDWLAIGRLLTDAFCTVAHDRVSGALVEDCHTAPDPERGIDIARLEADSRLVRRREFRYGKLSLLVLEFGDAGKEARRLRDDVGASAGCALDSYIAARTPPSGCDRQIVFVAQLQGQKRHRFDMISCSSEQLERAIAYVRAVAVGGGPRVLRAPETPATLRIPALEIDGFVGMSAGKLLSRHGVPRDIWPAYPEGFTWLFRVGGSTGLGVAVTFDRRRQARSAVQPCEERGGPTRR